MKKYPAVVFTCILCFFIACSKTSENSVSIRIENSTPQDFKEVFTNNKSFMNVKASDITSYQLFDKVMDLPFAALITAGNDTAYAGLVYYDPPFTYLTNGKYTLKIFVDTTVYYGYNCTYIKN